MFKFASTLVLGLSLAASAHAQIQIGGPATFEEGKHYFVIDPPQPVDGDKIEVLEVFSWGCSACNFFRPTVKKLGEALPDDAELRFMPVSFGSDDNWTVLQRAFYTAEALGILDQILDPTYDAIWNEGGPLRLADAGTNRPRKITMEQVAAEWAKVTGLDAADIVATSTSFAVNTRMKRGDAQLRNYGIDSTPSIVVNGKYRLTGRSAGNFDNIVPLVLHLIALEQGGD